MAKIDFSSLTTLIPEAVNDIKDLIKQELFTSSSLTEKITVVDGIKFGKKVGYLTKMTDIGKKAHASACSLNEVNAEVGTDEKTWTPRAFDTRIVLCADDVISSLAVKAIKAGVNRTDLTDTDYLGTFVDMLQGAMIEMYNRMTWISDMGAARFSDSPAGNFSDTVDGAAFDLDLVNMQYGFFYRIMQVLATETDQRVNLSTYNNQATYALQKSTMTSSVALATAKSLTTDLPLDFNYENQYFGCTRYFFNALRDNFQGFELETNKTDLQNGITGINIDGVTFAPVPEFDWMINRYHNNGTKWYNPHRVVAMRKDNLLLGVPDVSQWGLFEMFYDKLTRKFYIDIKDEFDTMVMHDKQIAMAF